MKTAVIHFIILGVISGLTSGNGVLPNDYLTAVGETVKFTTSLTPTEKPFKRIYWSFSHGIITYNIITSISSEEITSPEYEGRVTLFGSTGSLEIRNVTLHDYGVYRVIIEPYRGKQITGQTILDIYLPVSNVTVTTSNTDLMEFNSSISLLCSSSGSSLSFLWLNGSSEVTASDRVQFNDKGRSLTILNVTHYDQGPFRCHVSNPVSKGTSDPVNLSIRYGPVNVEILGPTKLEEKQTFVLFCSAESTPPATYSWILNGKEILNDSAVFIKNMSEPSDSGKYICQARNNQTGRTSFGEHTLSVQANRGLSVGGIAAIRLACFLLIGGALGGGFYIYKNKKNSNMQTEKHKTGQEETVYENKSVICENKK